MFLSAPRVLWFSASAAVLIVALSAAYFLFVTLPAAQRHRDDLAAEIARKQVSDKQVMDCAEQSRRAGEDMGKYSSVFGLPSHVSGVINHYNRKLSKCIVDVETVDKNGTVEYVMDAYQQSSILWCNIRFTPKMGRVCMDAKSNRIDPTDADKQLDDPMRE